MTKIRNIVFVLSILLLTSFGFFPIATEASVGNYYTSSYDGHLWVTDNVYTEALDTVDGNLISTAQTFVVGQDNNTGNYTVWEAGMYFDTSSIPYDSTIDSAILKIYVAADGSTTDFDITVVKGSSLTSPMDTSDFGKLQLMDEDLGHVTTSGISTSAYTSITLNAAGENEIVRGGTTKLGLRSSLDIAETAPAGDEYVDIWSYEKGYGYYPQLVVTYTESDLGTPSDFEVGPGGSSKRVAVFSDYVSDNDQLYVFMANVNYPFLPSQSPQDQFYIKLLDTDNSTVLAQSVLPHWGFRPESFYFNADSAPDWGEDYIIRIEDISTGLVYTDYTLVTADWRGDASSGLVHWCSTMARVMQSKDDEDPGTYLLNNGQLTEDGGPYFTTGIPLLGTQFPELFSYMGIDTTDTKDNDDTITAPTNKWGTNFQTAMGNFSSNVLNIPASMGKFIFCGFFFVLLPMGAAIGAMGTGAGGTTGAIFGIALLTFFYTQGMIPVIILVALMVLVVVMGVFTLVMKG